VGCSQLLKESEKPLQTGLPTGLNESQSSGPLGGDSPSVGEYLLRFTWGKEAHRDVFDDSVYSSNYYYHYYCRARDQIQGLMHARQIFYHQAMSLALEFLRWGLLCSSGWS
jgi:hypothetical protein